MLDGEASSLHGAAITRSSCPNQASLRGPFLYRQFEGPSGVHFVFKTHPKVKRLPNIVTKRLQHLFLVVEAGCAERKPPARHLPTTVLVDAAVKRAHRGSAECRTRRSPPKMKITQRAKILIGVISLAGIAGAAGTAFTGTGV